MIRLPEITATGVDCAAPPVNPDPRGEVQVYKVPVGIIPVALTEGSTLNPIPEQVAVVSELILALGSKLTNREKLVPLQEPEIVLT